MGCKLVTHVTLYCGNMALGKEVIRKGGLFFIPSILLPKGSLNGSPRKEGVWVNTMAASKTARPDQHGEHRKQYEINKKKILASQNICGICGKPVDKTLKYPDKMSPCIDHIIPVAKGGHPSDIENLQLAHWCCNRSKADKLVGSAEDFKEKKERAKVIGNRNLPLSVDWKCY